MAGLVVDLDGAVVSGLVPTPGSSVQTGLWRLWRRHDLDGGLRAYVEVEGAGNPRGGALLTTLGMDQVELREDVGLVLLVGYDADGSDVSMTSDQVSRVRSLGSPPGNDGPGEQTPGPPRTIEA